jgi:hypothetical protein
MKKIKAFLALAVLLIAATVLMSTSTSSGTSTSSKKLSTSESYCVFTPSATQYLGGKVGKDTLQFDVLVNKAGPVTAVALVDVKARVGTTDTYSFDLQGKHFSASSYASVFAGTGKSADYELADTTLLTEKELGTFYRYYRVELTTDDNCADTDSITFNAIYFKFHEW